MQYVDCFSWKQNYSDNGSKEMEKAIKTINFFYFIIKFKIPVH